MLTYSQKIAFPDRLRAIYDFLNSEYKRVLTDKALVDKILSVRLDLPQQKYWTALRAAIGEDTQYKWKNIVPVPSWYFCAFAEDIKRLLKSRKHQVELYKAIKNNIDLPINELYKYLAEKNIAFTSNQVSNFKNAILKGTNIELIPNQPELILNFSYVNKQASVLDRDKLTFRYQYRVKTKDDKETWDEIVLALCVSTKFNGGTVKKPVFGKSKTGEYYGFIPFEYEETKFTGDNILAVDIGKIKIYNAKVIKPNGRYSGSYIQSRQLVILKDKMEKVYKSRDYLLKKQDRFIDLHLDSEYMTENSRNKYLARQEELVSLNRKITNLKKNMSGIMAEELATLAKEHDCSSVFVEDLKWLNSTGGKWNHSEILGRVEQTLKYYGIDMYKVPAKNTSKQHPITQEIGKVQNRTVKFTDGMEIDRDDLASINIGSRTGKRYEKVGRYKKKIENKGVKITKLMKTEPTPKQVKRKTTNRKKALQFVRQIQENQYKGQFIPQVSQMVTYLSGASINVSDCINAAWVSVPKKQTQKNTILLNKRSFIKGHIIQEI